MLHKTIFSTTLVVFIFAVSVASANDWRSGIPWETPPKVTPGAVLGAPPSDAIILFDGTDLSAWDGGAWAIENGELVTVLGEGDITSKQRFGSVQLHLEFFIPEGVVGSDQHRGNSGVFIGPYEVQIIDSYENVTYYDGMVASIYKQVPPLVNASRPPGEWQTYSIIFNRPELKVENERVYVVRPGYITVIHNGVLVVNRHELQGTTFFHRPPAYEAHGGGMLPIRLQNHASNAQRGTVLRFRNIWVREIPDTNVRPEPTRAPFYMGQ